MSSERFLHSIDSYPNFCLKRRPSMSHVNPLPLQSAKSSPHFAPSLPDVDALFHYNNTPFLTTDHLEQELDAHLRKRLPRVTLHVVQESLEAVDFETEFGEPNKRTLPAYYYEASQTIPPRNNVALERAKDSARQHIAKQWRRNSAKTNPAFITPRAFAHPQNNAPVHVFSEHETDLSSS